MSAGAELEQGPRAGLSVAADLVALTKPRVTVMLVATIAAGALAAPGSVLPVPLALVLVATSFVMGSANALNMYLERDVDAEMERTCMRPLPTGRLAPRVALWFGLSLGVVGLAILTAGVNPTTGLLGGVALVSYVLAYTPLKRVTPLALFVGAVPGAMPPLLGWTAMTGAVDLQALVVFSILFFWQIPHFCAIAISRESEYRRAGIRVFSVANGLRFTKWVIVVFSAVMVAVSALPAFVGLTGLAYLVVAMLVGGLFLGWALRGMRDDAGVAWARSLFFASMPYLVLVYTALVVAAA